MIIQKESISLFDYPLFSIVKMETPSSESPNLPSDACVAYIVNGDGQTLSQSESISAIPDQSIVSFCGLTLGTMMSRLPKGNIHTLLVHFNRSVLSKVFEGEKPKLWEELEKPVTKFVVQTETNELISHYFSTIRVLFENQGAISESILKLKLKEIILLLLQSENSEYVRQIIKSLFSEKKFSFKELVDSHIENTDSLENLAMATNCSISTFKRKFREHYNTTPAKYRLQIRLKKVAVLLKASDGPVSEIGYQCGFETPEHLSRSFKKKYGVSPTEYRLNHLVK